MTAHRRFEVLCALAAAGQVRNSAAVELARHIEGCEECGSRLVDMAQVSEALLQKPPARQRTRSLPRGMKDRFVAHALREGVPLSRLPSPASPPLIVPSLALAFVFALVMLVVARQPVLLPSPLLQAGRAPHAAAEVSYRPAPSAASVSLPPPLRLPAPPGPRALRRSGLFHAGHREISRTPTTLRQPGSLNLSFDLPSPVRLDRNVPGVRLERVISSVRPDADRMYGGALPLALATPRHLVFFGLHDAPEPGEPVFRCQAGLVSLDSSHPPALDRLAFDPGAAVRPLQFQRPQTP